MRQIIYFLLLVLLTVSIDPVCEVTPPPSDKVYNAPTELQALNLSKFFSGYNLQYKISADSPEFRLVPPFWNNNAKDLPAPITDALDILTDSNLAWREQAASLLTRTTESFTVAFADLTPELLLDFNNDVEVKHAAPTQCFDVAMVDNDFAVVDCQLVSTKDGVTDIHYIVNARTKSYTAISMNGIVKTTARKTIAYTLENDVFLLSAVLYDGVDPSFSQSTFISVYHVDEQTHKTELVNIIDAQNLFSTQISITDITVDETGMVYLTDANCAIYQFRYLASNRVDKVGFIRYGTVFDKFQKVAAVRDSNGNPTVIVATPKQLIEYDWNNHVIRNFYELNEFVKEIVDFQINAHMIMVQTSTDYFFYRMGSTQYRDLLFTTPSLKSIGLLSQSIPQAVVVGNLRSLSYVVSNGYLEIIRPQDNITVTVTATSTTPAGNSTTCSQDFHVTVVEDTTLAYILQEPPRNISKDNPAVLRFKLSDNVIGPQLKYDPHISPGVKYDLSHIEDLEISGPQDGYKYFDTFKINSDSYYRLSQNGMAIQVDNCTMGMLNKITCVSVKNIATDGQLLAYSVFPLNGLQKKTVIAYVTSNVPGTINIAEMGADTTYKSLVVSEDYAITDLDGNNDFLYVTSQQASSISVYRIQANVYDLIHTLNRKSMTKLIPSLLLFKPRELAMSPVNPNILFVKNIDSVIILKTTSSRVTLISNIVTQAAPTEDLSERIVVGTQNFLIIRAKKGTISTSIVEYGIYDIYQPTVLRNIELINREVAWPVRLTNSLGSDFVYVSTVSTDSNDYFLTVLRMARPALGSNYAEFPLAQDSGFVAFDSYMASIVQIAGDGIDAQDKRIYYEPYLTVTASIDDSSFKKNFVYGINIDTPTSHTPFETTLQVVNYQANISPKGQSDIKITLPKSTNDLTVNLNLDPLFAGSVSSYSISCPDCGSDKIQLVDHVNRLADMAVPTTSQFLSIRQVGKLWVLTPRSINIVDDLTGKAIKQYPFSVDASTVCANWVRWDATTIVVMCRSTVEQFFLLVATTPTFDGVVGEPTKVLIDPAYWMTAVAKIGVSGKRLFLLDSSDIIISKGTINVFKVGDAGIAGEAIFTASDFGSSTTDKINDFQLLPTVLAPEKAVMLVTLNDYGLGHGVFDPAADVLALLPIGSIPLSKDDRLSDYQVNGNRYLQIEFLEQNNTPQQLIFNVLITTAHGQHFQLQLAFKIDQQQGLIYNDFWLYNTYNKYGSQTVLNWATSDYSFNNQLNYLLVGSYDPTKMKNSITCYPISKDQKAASIDFKGGLDIDAVESVGLSAGLYNASNGQLIIVANHPAKTMTGLYQLSNQVRAHFSYSDINHFDTITVTASNLLSKANQTVAVEFESEPAPQPDDDNGGIKWYIIVIIAVGVIIILGVVLFFYLRARKNRTDKASLLTENKEDVDEEI